MSSGVEWRCAHFSSSGNSTRREVLTTRSIPGSLPATIAPAKLSGCTSSPITLRLLFFIFVGSFLLFMLLVLAAGRKAGPGLRRNASHAIPEAGKSRDRLREGAARRARGAGASKSNIRGCAAQKRRRPATRVPSVRTHSAFNRRLNTAPLHRSSPCRHCLPLVLFLLPVPSETTDAPTPPPVQHAFFASHETTFPQLTPGRRSA